MQVAECRWYRQRRIAPIYRRPDYRRFPKLVRGNCPNCKRRNRTEGYVTCRLCREMLSSPLRGHLPNAGGWPEERAGPGLG